MGNLFKLVTGSVLGNWQLYLAGFLVIAAFGSGFKVADWMHTASEHERLKSEVKASIDKLADMRALVGEFYAEREALGEKLDNNLDEVRRYAQTTQTCILSPDDIRLLTGTTKYYTPN